MMSRKNYVRFAKLAKVIYTTTEDKLLAELIAEKMCEIFEEDNPRFDRERFLAAAGAVSEVKPPRARLRPPGGRQS